MDHIRYYINMQPTNEIGMRDRVLSSTEKNQPGDCIPPSPTPECVPTSKECAITCVDPTCNGSLYFMDKSYESWNTLGVSAFSALSLGTCVFTVLTINGFLSLLSCNSVFSILSLNSAFSVLSTNSAFAIGCVDKRFAVCF